MCMGIQEGISRKAASQWAVSELARSSTKAGPVIKKSIPGEGACRDFEPGATVEPRRTRAAEASVASPQPRWGEEAKQWWAVQRYEGETHGARSRGAVTVPRRNRMMARWRSAGESSRGRRRR